MNAEQSVTLEGILVFTVGHETRSVDIDNLDQALALLLEIKGMAVGCQLTINWDEGCEGATGLSCDCGGGCSQI